MSIDNDQVFEALFTDRGYESPAWSGVGPGWFPLLRDLLDDLKTLGFKGQIAQVKEKFGELRFYADGATLAQGKRIARAEAESARTCERCGKPGTCGNHNGGYWIKTLCLECSRREWQRR